jgi:16S rRNA (guanine527-N7)-methyltransferase
MGLTLKQGLRRLAEEPGGLAGPRLDMIENLLTRYIAEIELFNPAYGLVNVKNREDLVTRHILDSLAPLGIMTRLPELCLPAGRTAQIADVGSGAGLPGIPLAIALPDFRITLVERMGRRAGFLRNTIAVLGLDNAAVEEQEMEKAGPGRFDLLCFRALRPFEPALLKALRRLLAPGGVIAAYKGRRELINAEMEAAGWTGSWDCLPCPVPGLEEERHLVVLRGPCKSPL